MIRIDMKNYCLILKEKQEEYRNYRQVKLLNIIVVQVNKHLFLLKKHLKSKYKIED